MTDELQQAVDNGKLTAQAAEQLVKLSPGEFCQHKSWGFGRVAEWNLITGQILIDFKTRKGHPMQVQYAAEALLPIPANHILARKASDPGEARKAAENDPLTFVREILRDQNGRATVDQMSALLSPEIFDAPAFKKWWDSAKKKLKADGHFQMPSKKTEPIILLDIPVAPGRGLLANFRAARHLKDQITALDQITKALDDFAQEIEELQSLAGQIEDAANKGRRLQSAQALELLLARDEIIARHQALKRGEGAPEVADILRGEETRLAALFIALPASKHRRVLEVFIVAFGDRWEQKALRLAQESNARLVAEIHRLFDKEGKLEVFRAALARWISERSANTEILIWLCRERGSAFPELFNVDLFATVLSAMERDQLNEKRGSRLHDLLMEDRELLGELLDGAEPDLVRDAMRKLLMTPVFDDLNKRSLLGRIVKMYPELQSMISGNEVSDREETLTVSWASLERRKAEYEDLVTRQIPENLRDINIAKEEGDLRENFGFKAAKEQQRVLQRRKSESERDLSSARGTNFENPDTAQVSIGTIVTLRDAAGGAEVYSILGAWDSAPELGIVSYKAAIGQALLGRSPGDTAQLPSETSPRTVTIVSIVPFKDLELLREKVHLLAGSVS